MTSDKTSQTVNKLRKLDIAINLSGILAVLLMAFTFAAGNYFTKEIPFVWASYARTAGWVFISLYILGAVYQSREWLWNTARSERAQSGSNLLLQVVLVIAIVGALNYLGTRHHKRWDLTENKQYSLSEQTMKIVKDLPGKVKVTMFANPADRSNQNNRDLWAEYAYADAGKVEFRAIDADREPQKVMQFIQALPKDQQSKVLENGTVRLGTILLEYRGNVTPVTGYNEQDFTSALLKATRTSQKTLYWAEGHGESDPDSWGPEGMGQIKQALEKQNYKIDKLTLFTKTDVPADATVLVIAAPQKPYQEAEIQELTRYVARGGKVLLMLWPNSATGLEKWLAEHYATTPNQDIVLEMDPRYTLNFNPTMPAVVKYPFHAITQSFQNYRIATVFPRSRSFQIADKKPEGVVVEPLAESTDQSQGKIGKDIGAPFNPSTDLKGPLKLAVAITATTKASESASLDASASVAVTPKEKEYKGRLVAIGSPFFAGNQLAQRFGNGDFFLASMNWLAEEESLVSIPPKSTETRTVELLGGAQRNLGLGTVLFPPSALLLVGLLIWWRRR
ncbi:MAG: GldG family protein [Cyanobacteria bacterium NC_groundwater_1444_Ag_S-0.65um_54_12]|nr:GldG family protein [Cyanobacteria bacterium NC_groundwater_1444_Ag_S-0.65um_54_12]